MRSELRGWIPFRLRAGTADCRWLHVGDTRFTDPFFEETIARCMSSPENFFGPQRFTPLSQLPEIAAECDAVEPSAFVFHVSRCGSTLVSQLLALDDSCITLSEVPFFEEHRGKMRARAAFHAKYPQEKFSEAPPEDAAGDALRTCVGRYEELERFREASVSASRSRRAG